MSSIAASYVPSADAPEAPVAPLLAKTTPIIFVVPAFDEEHHVAEGAAALAPQRVRLADIGHRRRHRHGDGLVARLCVRVLDRRQGGRLAGFSTALERSTREALIVTLEADTTSDLDALPAMLARARAGADLVLASWVMVNVSRLRRVLSDGAALIVRRVLGIEAHTVSSFFRVYRASCLRRASARYGDTLIREPGFACKAELLAKIAAIGARIEEVPVGLDTSRRIGESKMPVFRTVLAYWRMMARQRLERLAA